MSISSKKNGLKKQALKITTPAVQEPLEKSTTSLDTLYIVNGSDTPVTLEINVGDEGQTSDMTIKLDDNIVVQNHPGDFFKTSLGTNKNLDGRKLSIVATIADTSRTTNFTSLSIHLKGGVNPADHLLSKTVDSEGQSVGYLCLIEFFKP